MTFYVSCFKKRTNTKFLTLCANRLKKEVKKRPNRLKKEVGLN